MRILCCGDRHWNSKVSIEKILIPYGKDTIVIHGCASGADSLAGLVAKENGMEILEFPANWKLYGRAAGPIRNKQMLDEGKPELVLAFHKDIENSKGTKNMLKQASRAGIPTRIIDY